MDREDFFLPLPQLVLGYGTVFGTASATARPRSRGGRWSESPKEGSFDFSSGFGANS